MVRRPLKVWEFGNTSLGTAKGDMTNFISVIQ